MPVLDRATACAILNKKTASDYLTDFAQQLRNPDGNSGLAPLKPFDRRVLRVLLARRRRGLFFAAPFDVAETLIHPVKVVRQSLARLKSHNLLPFEVRL